MPLLSLLFLLTDSQRAHVCWSPLTAGRALRQDRGGQDRGGQDEGGEWRVSEQEGSHEGQKGE